MSTPNNMPNRLTAYFQKPDRDAARPNSTDSPTPPADQPPVTRPTAVPPLALPGWPPSPPAPNDSCAAFGARDDHRGSGNRDEYEDDEFDDDDEDFDDEDLDDEEDVELPRVPVRVNDRQAEIQVPLAPLITELWKAELGTDFSRFDACEQRARLGFDTPDDLMEFLDIIGEDAVLFDLFDGTATFKMISHLPAGRLCANPDCKQHRARYVLMNEVAFEADLIPFLVRRLRGHNAKSAGEAAD